MGSFPKTYNDQRLGRTERSERWTCNLETPDLFSVVLSSTPRPRLQIANWFASYQLGFLTISCLNYWFINPEKGRGYMSIYLFIYLSISRAQSDPKTDGACLCTIENLRELSCWSEALDHQRVKPSNSLPLSIQVLKLGSR